MLLAGLLQLFPCSQPCCPDAAADEPNSKPLPHICTLTLAGGPLAFGAGVV